jgi:hypothetical protein
VIALVSDLRRRSSEHEINAFATPTVVHFTMVGALFVSGPALWRSEMVPLFVIASVTLMLLAIGIHNAWDTVTYIFLEAAARREQESPSTVASDQR